MLAKLALIALGGAAGSVLRYLLAHLAQRPAGDDFPLGILIVNVLGCLAIGLLWGALDAPHDAPGRRELQLLLIVGLLGGFTTFSTFAWDAVRLLDQGRLAAAGAYVLLSNALGIAAALAGRAAWSLVATQSQ